MDPVKLYLPFNILLHAAILWQLYPYSWLLLFSENSLDVIGMIISMIPNMSYIDKSESLMFASMAFILVNTIVSVVCCMHWNPEVIAYYLCIKIMTCGAIIIY